MQMFQRLYLLVCDAVWFSKMAGTFRGNVFPLLSIWEIQADGTLPQTCCPPTKRYSNKPNWSSLFWNMLQLGEHFIITVARTSDDTNLTQAVNICSYTATCHLLIDVFCSTWARRM